MKKNIKRTWYTVVTLVVVFTILIYTPVVTPVGRYKPELFGIPFTLWAGILISWINIGLTIYGSAVCPGSKRWGEAT
jgi:hypothetical protein